MELAPYQRIRLKREELGISQEVLAEMLGINQSAYAKIEQGNTQLTIDRLKQIAKALKISVIELLGEETSGNVIISEGGTNFGNQISIIQDSFENERKAFQAHIIDLQKQVESLQKIVEKLIGK